MTDSLHFLSMLSFFLFQKYLLKKKHCLQAVKDITQPSQETFLQLTEAKYWRTMNTPKVTLNTVRLLQQSRYRILH